MRKSNESISLKKRKVSRGTFFDGADRQSILVNPIEMGYSLSDFATDSSMAHLQLGIKVKTPLVYCIECFIEHTTDYEQRCCILPKITQSLIITKMKSKDHIKTNPALVSAVDELVILIQHAFWLALILPPNERHAVIVNLISQINFGKPAENTARNYSLHTFVTDCKAVLNQEHLKYFFDCMKAYNNTLTPYEKVTFVIDKLSQELLKIDSESNFYFIKHYSFLLSAIPNEDLRREALLHLFENYTHDIQGDPVYVL